MGKVKARGPGRRMRADRADFTTWARAVPPELNTRWTLPGCWKREENDFMLNVFMSGHILNCRVPKTTHSCGA